MCADDLKDAKTAVGKIHAVIFDAEVDRVYRELRDSIDAER